MSFITYATSGSGTEIHQSSPAKPGSKAHAHAVEMIPGYVPWKAKDVPSRCVMELASGLVYRLVLDKPSGFSMLRSYGWYVRYVSTLDLYRDFRCSESCDASKLDWLVCGTKVETTAAPPACDSCEVDPGIPYESRHFLTSKNDWLEKTNWVLDEKLGRTGQHRADCIREHVLELRQQIGQQRLELSEFKQKIIKLINSEKEPNDK